MKNIYSSLLAGAAALAMTLFVGCRENPTQTPEPDVPKVPTIALSEVIAKAGPKSAVVAATVANVDTIRYTYYKRDSRPLDVNIKWSEKLIVKDGVYEIEITDLESSLDDRTIYTFEAIGCKKGGVVTKNTTCSFQTIKAAPVMVKDVVASPQTISFIAEMLNEHCDAFHYTIVPKANFDKAMFLQEVKDGYFPPLKETTVIMEKYRKPGIVYMIAIQPYWFDAEEKFESFACEMIEIEATTLEYALGQKDVSVTMTPDLSTLYFAGIKAKISRADQNVGGFHFGVVTKAELGARSIETFLAESRWFYGGSELDENYMHFQEFQAESNDFEFTFALKPKTEYVIFVIASDKYGMVGNVASAPITTPDISLDDPATVAVTSCVAHADVINVELEYKNDCQKAYYFFAPKGEYKDADAQQKLIEIYSDAYATEFWAVGGEPSNIYGTTNNLDYELFMLPVSSKSKAGKMVKYEFASFNTTINFDESVVMTATPGQLTKFTYKDREEVEHTGYKVTITPSLGANATLFDYGSALVDTYNFPDGEPTDAKVCAQRMSDNWLMGPASKPDEQPEFKFYNETLEVQVQIVCVMPTKAEGEVKGMPLMFRFEIPAMVAPAAVKRNR